MPNQTPKGKRILALIGIILLVLMYLITLFAAIFDSSATGMFFAISLVATVFVPILIWGYVWMIGAMSGKKNFASLYPDSATNPETNPATDTGTPPVVDNEPTQEGIKV